MVSCVFYLKYLSQNFGQIAHVGGVLKLSGPAYFKSVPDFENKICGCDRSKQNKLPPLYIQIEVQLCLEAFSIFYIFIKY